MMFQRSMLMFLTHGLKRILKINFLHIRFSGTADYSSSLSGRIWMTWDYISLLVSMIKELMLFSGIAVLGGSFVLAFGALYASTHLHRSLLYNVLRSPMHFFDVTPVGRVTNRFSRDMDTVDTRVPHLLEGWINGLFILVETMIVISYSTPFFLAVLVPIAAIYIGAQVCLFIYYAAWFIDCETGYKSTTYITFN